MSTHKTLRSNPRIEVQAAPGWFSFTSFEEEKEQLDEMCEQILRHVDRVGSARVVWDSDEVCAYCDEPASGMYDEDGVPCCCDAAVTEHDARLRLLVDGETGDTVPAVRS